MAVDEDVAERAGILANRHLRSHPGVDPVDVIVAATVEREDAVLWTKNVKHFPMVAGLAPPFCAPGWARLAVGARNGGAGDGRSVGASSILRTKP